MPGLTLGRCRLCGSTLVEPVFDLAGRDAERTRVYQCLRCAVILPRFAELEDASLARQVEVHDAQWPSLAEDEAERLVVDYGHVVDFYRPLLGPPEGAGLVCEIGVGRGALLAAFRRAGYRVLGCDASPHLAGLAGQRFGFGPDELLTGTVTELFAHVRARGDQVRAFVLWHVLEHLGDPGGVLRGAAELLEPGGLVIFQSPLLDQKWLYAEHFFLLTEPAIRTLARDTGFTVRRIDYDLGNAFVAAAFERAPGAAPARDGAAAGADGFPDRLGQLERLATVFEERHEVAVRRMGELERAVWQRDEALGGLQRQIEEAERVIAHEKQEAEDRGTRLVALEREVAELRRALADRAEIATTLQAALDGQRAGLESLRGELSTVAAERDAFEALLHSPRALARRLAGTVRGRLGGRPAPLRIPPPVAAAGHAAANGNAVRSLVFSGREENRFWWHRLPSSAFVPPLYATLSDDEWALMEAWYQDTNAKNLVGEAAIPALSMLQGLVMGNMCRNVVQLGVYAGYSLLLVGFMMRRMGTPHAMFAVDIDASCVAYCREWLQRAGLEEFVRVEQGDSADPEFPAMAREYFGGPINLVFLDSSHQYRHTLSELDLWTDALNPGGFMFLHDTSEFAATFDASGEGGVHRAFAEWLGRHDEFHALNICNSNASHGTPSQVYKDGCGLGIIQKPA